MIEVKDKKDCCGCTACFSICAHKAITMEPDALGFLYPKINKAKCKNCGLCEKVCSFNEHYDISKNLEQPIAYAARHKDIHEVETSRSGAAFIAISDWVLEQGGVVYGVGYKDHFRVCHKRAINKIERDEFKGSKYVQSDLGDSFLQIKEDLKQGLLVLFSGTPCQTSGLSSFIGPKLSGHLILVDIVCHGVPGPYVWRDYLQYVEKQEHKIITSVNFRDKQLFGWKAHKESFLFADSSRKSYDKYSTVFSKCIAFRHSCGNCHFTNLRRPSDFTIADFWGWEKTDANINEDDKGCSLLFVNTEKAKNIFQHISDRLNFVSALLENTLQPNLKHPSVIDVQREAFENYYVEHGFEHTLKHFALLGWKYSFRKKITSFKGYVKRTLKKFLKK